MWVRGRPFRFGIQLRPQRTTWARYCAAVQTVEQLGFDTVWNSDHLLPAFGPDNGSRFETLTTLGRNGGCDDAGAHRGSRLRGSLSRPCDPR